MAAARQYLGVLPGPRCASWTAPDPRALRDVRAREPRCASTTCARVHARPGRRRLAAGAARRLRRRHPHRAGAHRGPAGRPAGQQPAAPGRRDRRRCGRQGRALHAAVQRARPAAGVAGRHARLHGRARDRGAGAGAPCQPHVRRRGAPARAVLRAWCCARATAWARWRWPAGGFHAPLFTVAWPSGEFGAHGPGRRGAPGLPQGARGRCPRARSARRCSSELVAAQYDRRPGASTWPPRWRSTR